MCIEKNLVKMVVEYELSDVTLVDHLVVEEINDIRNSRIASYKLIEAIDCSDLAKDWFSSYRRWFIEPYLLALPPEVRWSVLHLLPPLHPVLAVPVLRLHQIVRRYRSDIAQEDGNFGSRVGLRVGLMELPVEDCIVAAAVDD